MTCKRFFVVAALLLAFPALVSAQSGYSDEQLERYWQCMERHEHTFPDLN